MFFTFVTQQPLSSTPFSTSKLRPTVMGARIRRKLIV